MSDTNQGAGSETAPVEPTTITKRDAALEYLCLAVGKLRAKEGGDEVDLQAELAAEAAHTKEVCGDDVADLLPAIDATLAEDATSQGVLDAMLERDRHVVLADAAWNVVSWYIVDAVCELRGREDGTGSTSDREEIDLTTHAVVMQQKLEARGLVDAAEPWADNVNATLAKDATSDSVLATLADDDRVDVLAKVAEMDSHAAGPVEPTDASEVAAELPPIGQAMAKLRVVVEEGKAVEAADAAAREAAEEIKAKRDKIKARVKKAEDELRGLDRRVQVARANYRRMALADRPREARLAAAVRTLRTQADRVLGEGGTVPEDVARVLAAADKGEAINSDVVG